MIVRRRADTANQIEAHLITRNYEGSQAAVARVARRYTLRPPVLNPQLLSPTPLPGKSSKADEEES
jgi:hypothetical protein